MKIPISEKLKTLRKLKGFTQVEVSKRTGINNKTLSSYENGGSEPDLATLSLLADFYEVTTDYLLGRTDDPTPPAKRAGDVLDAKKAPPTLEAVEGDEVGRYLIRTPEDEAMVQRIVEIIQKELPEYVGAILQNELDEHNSG